MHTPISTLKTAARESEATTVVDVVRRLFNLQSKSATSANADALHTVTNRAGDPKREATKKEDKA
jgi:hypothetical protein